jgi:hypothetical protein
MVVKKYSDGTYNIFYEKGDFVKIKDISKYGQQEIENAQMWGEVIKVEGKPLTAKLIIDTGDGQISEYVFNVLPVNAEGVELTEEEILDNETVTERKIEQKDYKTIIKFKDF